MWGIESLGWVGDGLEAFSIIVSYAQWQAMLFWWHVKSLLPFVFFHQISHLLEHDFRCSFTRLLMSSRLQLRAVNNTWDTWNVCYCLSGRGIQWETTSVSYISVGFLHGTNRRRLDRIYVAIREKLLRNGRPRSWCCALVVFYHTVMLYTVWKLPGESMS